MSRRFRLVIERYAPPGLGLGFAAGKAVFVAGAVVGDELEVEVEKEKRRHIIARLTAVLCPGPDRREAPCPHFPECGGCDLLQLAYSEQLKVKGEMLRQQLAAALAAADLASVSVAASPGGEAGGRYRVRCHYDPAAARFGFYARRRHRVIPVAACRQLAAPLRRVLDAAGRSALPPGTEELRLLASSQGGVAAVLGRGRRTAALPGYPETLYENYGAGEVELSAAGFAQASPLLTRRLLADLIDLLPPARTLLELYGGSGTFTLALASRVRRLEVWESDPGAVARNRRNLAGAGYNRVRVVRTRVERRPLPAGCEIVVADPPRAGLPFALVERLRRSSARELFYISCNPATLARDLARLEAPHPATRAFRLETLRAYDMYPGTTHLELLARLVRTV